MNPYLTKTRFKSSGIKNTPKAERLTTIEYSSRAAEETVNAIIDYFAEQGKCNKEFNITILKAVKAEEDVALITSLIHHYKKNSAKISYQGMKNILDSFCEFSDLSVSDDKNCFTEVDFIIEPEVNRMDSCAAWVEQTIDEPWFIFSPEQ